MRTVYVDSINHCHPANDGTMTSFQTEFFVGKCDAFIEGYCVELDGNGNIQKRYPWKPYSELDAAQRAYEQQLLADYRAALTTLGVTV